ncbi:MAG: hypothetical protein WC476_10220 [Phycisphaerae bacterium]|jgi:uncharacterized protein HemX
MSLTYTLLLIAAIVVALGWVGYGIWYYKMQQEEKKQPIDTKKTEHLNQVKKSFEEYAKKMGEYKLKAYDKKDINTHHKD